MTIVSLFFLVPKIPQSYSLSITLDTLPVQMVFGSRCEASSLIYLATLPVIDATFVNK